MLIIENSFPVIDAEEVGTVEISGTDGVEIVAKMTAVGVGGEDKLTLARERLMEMGHVEVLISACAQLVKFTGH